MGSPQDIKLIELGPGRGTMMRDALRAAQLAPDFRRTVSVHLVEISPALQRMQEANVGSLDVPVQWHRSLEEVPQEPMIVLANEFIDALPVQQAVRQADGWHQRLIGIDAEGKFVFQLAPDPLRAFEALLPRRVRDAEIGALYEWRSDHFMFELGRRVARNRGVALIIDYGHVQSDVGETFQAVGEHAFADPLSAPGTVDITAHVDFQAAAMAAESMRARVHGPIGQGEFLRRLGIDMRAAALQAATTPDNAAEIAVALDRLTGEGRTGMGDLFKVMGLSYKELDALPGFEA
jgi:SAM-dependent MidA family methyltransferase